MKHQLLISYLEKEGGLTPSEKENIRKNFKELQLDKNQVVIHKNNAVDKLFFVNNGFLRSYYLTENEKEITRTIAWQGRFLTNLSSFRDTHINQEIIQSITPSEVLYITKTDFEKLINSSPNIKLLYIKLLKEYTAENTRRLEVLNVYTIQMKFQYLKTHYPHFINQLSDSILASFLGISRVHFSNNKNLLI